MNAPLKAKPKKAEFAWHDPLLLESQLSESERMVRDAARAYAQEKLQPQVYAAVKQLPAGQISDPVSATDGLHIVVMNELKAPEAQNFAAVRERVWNDLKTEAQDRIRNATYSYLRSKADIIAANSY